MEEKFGKIITQPTYFRLPDLMTIASEEGEHAIDGPSEFTVIMTGIILDYDEIVMCKCNYPNRGEDNTCIACEESLKDLERMRFWRLIPNMQDVDLKIEPLDIGPDVSVYEPSPELDES